MRVRMVIVGLAAVLVVGACSGDAKPTQDPQVAFCSSVKSLASAIKTFKSMDAQDTISDIQASGEAVQTAFQAFKDAAGSLATSQVGAIQTAAENLQGAIADIPSTDTVDQAITSLVPQVEALEAARFEAGKAQCGEVKLEATPVPSTAPATTPVPAAS